MLLLLLIWIYITATSFTTGFATWQFLSQAFKVKKANTYIPHFTLLCVTGFVTISFISGLSSLLVPVDNKVQILILLFALGCLGRFRKDIIKAFQNYFQEIKTLSLFWKIASAAVILLALAISSSPTRHYDEGLYYLQSIRWIREYGLIPGLGNLHSRLAFNSNWHLLSAAFSFPFIKGYVADDINSLFFVLIGLYAISGMQSLKKGPVQLSLIIRSLLVLPAFFFYTMLMAPAADLAVTYFIWLIMLLFLEKTERLELSIFDQRAILIYLLSFYLISVKLSSLVILILPAYLFMRQSSTIGFRNFLQLIFLAMLIFAPWLTRNWYLSGYLVYPVEASSIFHPDWKIPPARAKEEVISISSWAKAPGMDLKVVMKMGIKDWFPIWWKGRKIYEKALFCLILLASLANVLIWLRSLLRYGEITRTRAGRLVLVATALAGILFWFVQAPDFRFGFGYILFYCFLTFSIISWDYMEKISWQKRMRIMTFLFFTGLLLPTGLLAYFNPPIHFLAHYIIKPAPVPFAELKTVVVSGVRITVPTQSDQCWDADLPCTPILSPWLQMRSKNIKDGFRVSKTDESLKGF